MGMKGALAILVLLSAAPASAQRIRTAPVEFVPSYLGSVSLSLRQDPFFASRLLGTFHAELAQVAAAPTPRAAAEGLKARIEGPGRQPLAQVAANLGTAPLTAERAAAVLAANALARPDQFREVASGLETLRPGLGARAVEALREAPGGQALMGRLRELGRQVVPQAEGSLYDATGALRRMFDGR